MALDAGIINAVSSGRDSREARRTEAEVRNQELTKAGYSFKDGAMQVRENSQAELEQLQIRESIQLAKSLQAKLLAQKSEQRSQCSQPRSVLANQMKCTPPTGALLRSLSMLARMFATQHLLPQCGVMGANKQKPA